MNESNEKLKNILLHSKEVYKHSIPEKMKRLQDLVNHLHERFDEETLRSLRLEVHKLAGNAGTYGYMPVSKICKQFDEELLLMIQNLKSIPNDPNWSNNFDAYLNKIKEGFLDDNQPS